MVGPMVGPMVGAPVGALVGERVGSQVAALRFPAEQLLTPDTVYPVLHSGWQCDPDASWAVQLPTAPFRGAADASQTAVNIYNRPPLSKAAIRRPFEDTCTFRHFQLPVEE